MRIFLIRHGVTPLNIAKKVNGEVDEPLAPEGFEQAHAVIPSIPSTIKYIYTSPLLRAQQTAHIIGEAINIPAIVRDELTEIRMGSLAGKAWEEMERGDDLKFKHRSVAFDYRPFGGESLAQVKKRVLSFIKEINTKHASDEVLFVTHGGLIRLINLLEQGKVVSETEKHVSILQFDLEKILNRFKDK
jgi:broad specificity phosphatase PhoE